MDAVTLLSAIMSNHSLQLLAGHSSGRSACWTYLGLVKLALENGRRLVKPDGSPYAQRELGWLLHMGEKWFGEDLATLRRERLVEQSPETGAVGIPLLSSLPETDPLLPPAAPRPAAPADISPVAAPPSPTPAEREAAEAAAGSAHISEAEYRTYFTRMRINGAKDATAENEEEFWQYLVQADFRKMTGELITKQSVGSTFIAWRRHRRQESEEDARRAEDERRKADEERQRLEARERMNDMILRSESETNWDEE